MNFKNVANVLYVEVLTENIMKWKVMKIINTNQTIFQVDWNHLYSIKKGISLLIPKNIYTTKIFH